MAKYTCLALLVISALLCGCQATKLISPTLTNFDVPVLDKVTERELGDTLIDRGTVKSYAAIILDEPIEGHVFAGTIKAPAGSFLATAEIGNNILFRSATPLSWNI